MTGTHPALQALLAATLLTTAPGTVAAADAGMGRLFFSPEQRSLIDRQVASRSSHEEPPGTGGFTIDGEVRHGSGLHTVWINKQIRHQARSDSMANSSGNDSQIVTSPSRIPGQIVLSGPGIPHTTLKVGTALSDKQEIADPVAGSRITIHRERPALEPRIAR